MGELQGTWSQQGDRPQETSPDDHAKPPRSRRKPLPGDEDQRGKDVFGQGYLRFDGVYNTTRAGCICGLSVALEDIVAFLYKYSTLNYEKQQRKLCLVLAVLVFLCSEEVRGPLDNHGD
jgi:hypothetical protein